MTSIDVTLTPVFAHRGPFVTVYLDATRAGASAAGTLDERWASIRDDLATASADPDTLDAVEEVLPVGLEPGRTYGVVVVAADGEVVLRERFDPPPATTATYSPLPRLLPYLAARAPDVAHLVVAADNGRTRVLRIERGEAVAMWPTGGTDRLDAPGVARVVARFASRIDPELVLVSGDEDSAGPILAALSHVLVAEVAIRVLPAAPDADALLRMVVRALHAHGDADRAALLARLREPGADRRATASGARDVSAALRMAQVETLVMADGPGMAQRCWVGARPTEFGVKDADAADVGVALVRHDQIGAAMVRAAVATGARVLLSRPGEPAPPHGVAALLR